MIYKVHVIRNLAYQMPPGFDARKKVIAYIRSLESHPIEKADYVEVAPSGKRYYTALIGQTAVSYWIDEGAMEVTVTSICDADQPQ